MIKFDSFHDFADAARAYAGEGEIQHHQEKVRFLQENVRALQDKVFLLEGKVASAEALRDSYKADLAKQPVSFPAAPPPEYANQLMREVCNENTHYLCTKLNDLCPGQRIQQIKIIRHLTGWGLKESKDYVDNT